MAPFPKAVLDQWPNRDFHKLDMDSFSSLPTCSPTPPSLKFQSKSWLTWKIIHSHPAQSLITAVANRTIQELLWNIQNYKRKGKVVLKEEYKLSVILKVGGKKKKNDFPGLEQQIDIRYPN